MRRTCTPIRIRCAHQSMNVKHRCLLRPLPKQWPTGLKEGDRCRLTMPPYQGCQPAGMPGFQCVPWRQQQTPLHRADTEIHTSRDLIAPHIAPGDLSFVVAAMLLRP